MKKYATLFLPFFPLLLQSQSEPYKKILNDPDVIWAAELDLQFVVEPEFFFADSIFEQNLSTPLKFLNHDPGKKYPEGVMLAAKLMELCLHGKQAAFDPLIKDSSYDAAHRLQHLRPADTITVIDPETTMEYNTVVYHDLDVTSIVGVRVLQLLYYREKSAEFYIYTLAYAPVFSVYTNTEPNAFLYQYTPYWFSMPPWSAKSEARQPDLHSTNITWARRMKTGNNSPALAEIQPFKDFKPPIMQQVLNRFRENPKFHATYTEDGESIPFETREGMIQQIDTVASYDPETYEEITKVIQTEITGFDMTHLRLSQDWFWDDKRQQLIIRLHAFGPMRAVKDWEGNFRYSEVLFWKTLR